MTTSPYDGTMYMAPTDERVGIGAHTRLVSYDYDKDEFKLCVEVEKLILPHPLQMPHSKLHTSINFLPDGTVIATTHTTAGPAHHPSWMPLAHVDHVWDGFAGSNIIHYDPKTGHAENWGVPVPRESIYGACYDPKHNCLYMIGFMRGHVYCFDIDTRTVKDLGKQAEIFNFRLHLGPDGNIYSMSKSGCLYRVNTETRELEDLNWRVPAYPGLNSHNTHYRYMVKGQNLDDHRFVFSGNGVPEFFLFDTDTLTVTHLGKRAPFDHTSDFNANQPHIESFAMDKYGVIWYTLKGYPQLPIRDDFYHYPSALFLLRWDIKNGGKPECLGIMDTVKHEVPVTYDITYDKFRDVLYFEGSGYVEKGVKYEVAPLGIMAIDLAQFRQHMYEPGPVYECKVTPFTEEEIAAAKAYVKRDSGGEEVNTANPVTCFPISDITPLRLWRRVPHTEIPESKVIGLAWDGDCVYGTCGDNGVVKYAFKIVPQPYKVYASREEAERDDEYIVMGSIFDGMKDMNTWIDEAGNFCVETPACYAYRFEWIKPIGEVCDGRRKWMEANLLPGPVNIDPSVKLPEVVGRRYLSKATATALWHDGSIAVGTADAMFAMVRGRRAFSFGNCASLGPVRCMCTNAARTKLYGVAGHELSLSVIFSFDEDEGLKQLGVVNYNSEGFIDGPSASNILSSIVLSPDEKYLAVGGADRIGAVHIIKL